MDLLTVLALATPVLYALGLLMTAIAKLTPNTTDDKLAGVLVLVHDFLAKLLPGGGTLAQKRAPVVRPPVVHPK